MQSFGGTELRSSMGTSITGWVGKGRERDEQSQRPCPKESRFYVEGSRQPLKFAFRKATGCRVEGGDGVWMRDAVKRQRAGAEGVRVQRSL